MTTRTDITMRKGHSGRRKDAVGTQGRQDGRKDAVGTQGRSGRAQGRCRHSGALRTAQGRCRHSGALRTAQGHCRHSGALRTAQGHSESTAAANWTTAERSQPRDRSREIAAERSQPRDHSREITCMQVGEGFQNGCSVRIVICFRIVTRVRVAIDGLPLRTSLPKSKLPIDNRNNLCYAYVQWIGKHNHQQGGKTKMIQWHKIRAGFYLSDSRERKYNSQFHIYARTKPNKHWAMETWYYTATGSFLRESIHKTLSAAKSHAETIRQEYS